MLCATRVSSAFVGIALGVVAVGCTTYHDQLARGQRAFEQNEHDRTLAILRDLEPDVKRLTPPEQARYAYLRGMSDYRIGYKADARHWLSVARASEESSPGVLPGDWRARTSEALDAMNKVVYAQGTSALETARAEETSSDAAREASGPTDPAVGAKESGAKDGKGKVDADGAAKKSAPSSPPP